MPSHFMGPQHEDHLLSLIEEFTELVDKKYRAGVREHGGGLWEMDQMDLLDNAIGEAVDQVVYLLTLRNKLKGAVR